MLKPRSLTVHFVSRAEPGELDIMTRIERKGHTLSTVSARATQDGRLIALALSALAADRIGPLVNNTVMPDVPLPGNLARAPDASPCPPLPRQPVLRHYETRLALGRPFSGAEARSGGWVRPLKPR